MKLDTYIRETGTTEAELAARAGVSQPTVNRLRNGKGNHSLAILHAIHRATEGVVTPNDFLIIESEPRHNTEAA